MQIYKKHQLWEETLKKNGDWDCFGEYSENVIGVFCYVIFNREKFYDTITSFVKFQKNTEGKIQYSG